MSRLKKKQNNWFMFFFTRYTGATIMVNYVDVEFINKYVFAYWHSKCLPILLYLFVCLVVSLFVCLWDGCLYLLMVFFLQDLRKSILLIGCFLPIAPWLTEYIFYDASNCFHCTLLKLFHHFKTTKFPTHTKPNSVPNVNHLPSLWKQ